MGGGGGGGVKRNLVATLSTFVALQLTNFSLGGGGGGGGGQSTHALLHWSRLKGATDCFVILHSL